MKSQITFVLLGLILMASTSYGQGQEPISLEQCYALVESEFPLAAQLHLLDQKNTLNQELIAVGKMPRLDLAGQASYQSEVTHVPLELPGMEIPIPNKDQYRLFLNAEQLIWGAGSIDALSTLHEQENKVKQQQVRVSLYQLKQQINQLYFSILLADEQVQLIDSSRVTLRTKRKEVESGIRNGMILPSADLLIAAELIKLDQGILELQHARQSLLSTLSRLTGLDLNEHSTLLHPVVLEPTIGESLRPEITLFDMQATQIDAAQELISKKRAPKVMGFATGGYGNPGLNMLDNTFQAYYIMGLKFNWNIMDWKATSKEKDMLQLDKQLIDTQRATFLLQTAIETDRSTVETKKLQGLIDSDKERIELLRSVVHSTEIQLYNGIITSATYLTEQNRLLEAETTLSSHEIQLLLAHADHAIQKGTKP